MSERTTGTGMTRSQPSRALLRPSDTLGGGSYLPALDLSEAGDHYRVDIELPGFNADALDVEFERGTLVIRGQHGQDDQQSEQQSEQPDAQSGSRRVERRSGSFSRAVRIAAPVNAEAISAEYRLGVLTVRLPKAEESRPKQIRVTGATSGGDDEPRTIDVEEGDGSSDSGS